MGKVAIIGDIHGNREALKAAFADIDRRGCDRIVCLGDIIAKGSFGDECVAMVREKCDVAIRGNCDDYYINDDQPRPVTPRERARILSLRSTVSPENQRYIMSLPMCCEMYVSGRLVRILHAGPDTVYDYTHTMPDATLQEKQRMFLGGALTVTQAIADVVIYGHIHTPMMTKLFNRTLICAGSVGNNLDLLRDADMDADTLNTTCVNYVLLEGNLDSRERSDLTVSFVQTPYDIQKELADSRGRNPDYDALRLELGRGVYRNMALVERERAARLAKENKAP